MFKTKYNKFPGVILKDFRYAVLQKILHLMVPDLPWYHFFQIKTLKMECNDVLYNNFKQFIITTFNTYVAS